MAQRSDTPIQRTRAKMRYMSEHLGGLQRELQELKTTRKSIETEHNNVNDRIEKVEKDLSDNEIQFHDSYCMQMEKLCAIENEKSEWDFNAICLIV